MGHPIVGVWAVDVRYADRPRTDRGTLLFHEDGTVSLAFSGYSAHAVWSGTGGHTAVVTGTRPVGPNEGFVGWHTLTASVTVADDGMSCVMEATESRPRPDGSLVEQRASITGTRLTVVLPG